MLCERIRMAHDNIAAVCARCLPLVPFVAVAVPALRLDAPDHRLDRQHSADLLRLALTHTRAPMGASWLGYVARILFRGDHRRDHRAATVHQTGGSSVVNGLVSL